VLCDTIWTRVLNFEAKGSGRNSELFPSPSTSFSAKIVTAVLAQMLEEPLLHTHQ
jgi:hypothetical protein